jgi:hypothetical protein
MAASLVRERAHCGQQGLRCSLVATALLDECKGLRSQCGRLMTTLVVGLCRQHCLVATALLDECEGLRSPCGRLMMTSVVGLRCQHCLVAMALLDECEGLRSPSELGHISPKRGHVCGELGCLLLCLSKCGPLALFCGKGILVALCLGECGPLACFLGKSVLEAGTSGFLLLLIEELLAAGSLLAGASGSSLLVGASGLLVKELLAAGSLLVPGTSGFLVEEE